MSYGQIVSALARSLGTHIIGYDNMPDHGGCILYMRGRVKRIDITTQALELGADELAVFIRDVITDQPEASTNLRIGLREGGLVVL